MKKEDILELLSDNEVARVSRAEEGPTLADGVEFVDLDHLERGVQRADAGARAVVHSVIPRTAVSDETWQRIEDALAA